MNANVSWYVPTSEQAEKEIRNLKLSEILDRSMEVEKIRDKSDPSSDEYMRATQMLKACYSELGRRYAGRR